MLFRSAPRDYHAAQQKRMREPGALLTDLAQLTAGWDKAIWSFTFLNHKRTTLNSNKTSKVNGSQVLSTTLSTGERNQDRTGKPRKSHCCHRSRSQHPERLESELWALQRLFQAQRPGEAGGTPLPPELRDTNLTQLPDLNWWKEECEQAIPSWQNLKDKYKTEQEKLPEMNSCFHWPTATPCPSQHQVASVQFTTVSHTTSLKCTTQPPRSQKWVGKEDWDRKTDLQRLKFFRMQVIPVASLQRELGWGLGVNWAGSCWAGHETPFGCIGNGNRRPTALLLQHCFSWTVKHKR